MCYSAGDERGTSATVLRAFYEDETILLANIKVEVFAQGWVVRVGVCTKDPAVHILENAVRTSSVMHNSWKMTYVLVEVVLASTTRGVSVRRCLCLPRVSNRCKTTKQNIIYTPNIG